MLIDPQTLENVRFQFVELGRAISTMSSDIKHSVDTVQSSLTKLQSSLQSAVDPEAFEDMTKAVNEISDVSADYVALYSRFEGTFDGLDAFGDSLKSASEKFGGISKDIESLSGTPTEAVRREGEVVSSKREPKRRISSPPGLLKKEYSSAKGKIKGMLSTLKIPAIGGVAAGAIAWMAYGFQEKDRMQAEAGEVRNIMVTAFDGMAKDMVSKGTRYVAGFQEQMQKFFGISKEEVQNVAKAFVDGGVSIESMLSGFDKKLGKVGKNFMSFSLAVDKMYEMSGGTTAQRMVQYASDYGKSMGEAKDTVEKLFFLGQESGLGVENFVEIVEKSGDSLKKLGFDIDKVADLAVKMQESFEKIGVPKRFAGRQIALGLDQMSSGLANMSEGWQTLIAQKMGYGEGLEGRQKFLEASSRVAEGRGAEDTERFIVTTVNTVMEAVRGDEVRARYILQKDLGFGFEGARIAKMITDAANSGDRLKSKEITKKYQKQIKDALQTEAQKQSRFQRQMNAWMKGIADIGQGVLGLVGNFLASLIAYLKALPEMFSNLFSKDRASRNVEIMDQVLSFQKDNVKYQNLIKGGFKKLQKAGAGMGKNILGSAFGNIQKAMAFDPTSQFRESSKGFVEPSRPFKSVPPPKIPPTVQMVTIPVRGPGMYEAGGPEEKYKSFLGWASAKSKGETWVGTGLQIVSQGVDESGNISVGLVGDCPRCGLVFGEGFDAEAYKEAIKGQPLEFFNPNTGKSLTVDPMTEAGMNEFSRFARGRSSRKAGSAGHLDPKLGRILTEISQRFPGKRLQVYSGHREGEKGPHGQGIAMDIGVEGVPKEDLFRFLRSNIKGGGKGFYPKQPYVHIDTRPGQSVWVDFSKKGESSKDQTIKGSEAKQWLNKNIGWERGGESDKRFKQKGPEQSYGYDVVAGPEQTVME